MELIGIFLSFFLSFLKMPGLPLSPRRCPYAAEDGHIQGAISAVESAVWDVPG
jgi:hypothetical protein